jgi:hypothetical protein
MMPDPVAHDDAGERHGGRVVYDVVPSVVLEVKPPAKPGAARPMPVVHDHIIVGKQGHASFRGLGLI